MLRKKMIKNSHGNEIFGNSNAIWDKKRPFLRDEIRCAVCSFYVFKKSIKRNIIDKTAMAKYPSYNI